MCCCNPVTGYMMIYDCLSRFTLFGKSSWLHINRKLPLWCWWWHGWKIMRFCVLLAVDQCLFWEKEFKEGINKKWSRQLSVLQIICSSSEAVQMLNARNSRHSLCLIRFVYLIVVSNKSDSITLQAFWSHTRNIIINGHLRWRTDTLKICRILSTNYTSN